MRQLEAAVLETGSALASVRAELSAVRRREAALESERSQLEDKLRSAEQRAEEERSRAIEANEQLGRQQEREAAEPQSCGGEQSRQRGAARAAAERGAAQCCGRQSRRCSRQSSLQRNSSNNKPIKQRCSKIKHRRHCRKRSTSRRSQCLGRIAASISSRKNRTRYLSTFNSHFPLRNPVQSNPLKEAQ